MDGSSRKKDQCGGGDGESGHDQVVEAAMLHQKTEPNEIEPALVLRICFTKLSADKWLENAFNVNPTVIINAFMLLSLFLVNEKFQWYYKCIYDLVVFIPCK